MAGDSYQAPSFAWLHALSKAGSSAVTTVETLSASGPKTRILDHKTDRRMIRSASGNLTIRVDRGVGPREPVDRLVIAGHNLTNTRGVLIKDTNQDGLWSATTTIAPYSRLRGSTAGHAYRGMHAGVNVIDFPSTSDRYIGVLFESRASNIHELGECIFTRKRTPTYAFQPSYQDPYAANLASRRLVSGVELIRQNGSALRSWEIDTTSLYGADLLLYEAMLRETGYGRDLIVFDGTPAGYETSIEDFDNSSVGVAISGWTTSGVTSFYGLADSFDGDSRCAAMTTTGSAGSTAFYAPPTALDLRCCILRWATLNFSSISHLTTTANSYVQLWTSTGHALYQFGTNHITAADNWFQLSIDIDNDTPSSVSGSGFDPSNVTTISFGNVVGSGTRVVYFDDIHYIRKDRAPLVARVVPEYGVRQSHPNPAAAGEKRLLSLQIIEDLG